MSVQEMIALMIVGGAVMFLVKNAISKKSGCSKGSCGSTDESTNSPKSESFSV